MAKYLILLASVLIQTCIGGLYAWSEFVPALKDGYGLSTAQTQVIFGALIAVFTVSMVFAGRLMRRSGPAPVAAIGGALFGGGYLLASYSGGSFWPLFAGISIVSGIGTGFCYVCPLAMCAKWFPRRKGLVTGVAMAGFGGGAVLLSGLGEAMFARGYDVLSVFRGVGVLYGAVIFLAALPLRFPPGIEIPKTGHHTAELLRDGYFWGLCCGLFAGTFGGLLVIGNLKPLLLAQNVDHVTATAAISVFAAGNACGRIGWGWLADRLGALAIPLSLAFLALTLPLLLLLPGSAPGAILASALIGCGFGACFVVYAAQISTHYGVANIAAVYPLVFLSYGLSGLAGPSVGGLIFDATASYSSGIIVSLVIVFCGLAASRQLMRAPVAQRCFPEGEPV